MCSNKTMKFLTVFIISLFLLYGCGEKKSVLAFRVNGDNNSSSAVSNSVSQLEQSALVVRLSDRYYVTSLLSDVFGPTAMSTLNNNVKIRMDSFGGGCDQYDRNVNSGLTCLNDDCNMINCNGATVLHNQIGVSSVIRQGWVLRACEEITNSNDAITYAAILIGAVTTNNNRKPIKNVLATPTRQTMASAYGLFYRSTSPSDDVLTALNNVAVNETTSNLEKWRYIFLSLCTTPEWQVP